MMEPTPGSEGSLSESARSRDSEHPSSHDLYRELRPPSRPLSTATQQIMQSALYRSWCAFVRSATQLDGSRFSDKTRAQLQSAGTGFLVFVQRERGNDQHSPAEVEAALRVTLPALSRELVEKFLSLESAGTPTKLAQLRSVLRHLVRPWLEGEKLLAPDAFPAPEPTHPAEELFQELEIIASLERYLKDAVNAGHLAEASTGNVRRILQRFLRYSYDACAGGEDASAVTASTSLGASDFEQMLRQQFDTLVARFCEHTGPHAVQSSRSSAHSAQSALLRHIRPLMLPDSPLHERPRQPPPRTIRPPHKREKLTRVHPADIEVEGTPRTEATALPPTEAPNLTPDIAPPEALPSVPEVTAADYNAALESAVVQVCRATTRSRNDIAKLGLNDIRVMPHEVRILPPPITERTPSVWIHLSDPGLRVAITHYSSVLKASSVKRAASLFFVSFSGGSIAPPPPSATKRKFRR